jgi:hypothetical protein
MTEFKNESKEKFVDISSEMYREYIFPNSTQTVKIDLPLKLSVSSAGGHRIFDASGESHYIPKGWIHLKWRAKEDHPHFVK